jgi:hypothetical protein
MMAVQPIHDGADLFDALSLPEDHLRESPANRPMNVQLREPQIVQRQVAKPGHCR